MNKKVAVITGASKGIGRACAEQFLNAGYVVIDASRTNPNPIENENWIHIKTDVAKEADIENLFNEVKNKYGRVDVLINNAGYGKFNKIEDTSTQEFDDMFAVNVRGLYLCTRYFIKMMMDQSSGTIINIASLAGKNGFATGTLYCATKHAVMGLSRALMLEARSHNIRVIAVCPGSVDTEFFVDSGTTPKNDPKTFLTSDDVAKACLLSAELPISAAMNEIELRPTNPHS